MDNWAVRLLERRITEVQMLSLFAFLLIAEFAQAQAPCAPGANCSQGQLNGTSIGTQIISEKPDRHLDQPGSVRLLSMLKSPKESQPITIVSLSGAGSQERYNFAAEIKAFLKNAGFNVADEFGSYMPIGGPTQSGVVINLDDKMVKGTAIYVNDK